MPAFLNSLSGALHLQKSMIPSGSKQSEGCGHGRAKNMLLPQQSCASWFKFANWKVQPHIVPDDLSEPPIHLKAMPGCSPTSGWGSAWWDT